MTEEEMRHRVTTLDAHMKARPSRWSDWERNFVRSVVYQLSHFAGGLTDKQREVINKLYERTHV